MARLVKYFWFNRLSLVANETFRLHNYSRYFFSTIKMPFCQFCFLTVTFRWVFWNSRLLLIRTASSCGIKKMRRSLVHACNVSSSHHFWENYSLHSGPIIYKMVVTLCLFPKNPLCAKIWTFHRDAHHMHKM